MAGYGYFEAPWKEMGEYWVQLSAAKLVAGSYILDSNVTACGCGDFLQPDVNYPKAKIGNGGGWWLSSDTIVPSNPFGASYWGNPSDAISGKHIFWLTGTLTTDSAGAATLTPTDAYAMDSKMDDGLPKSGNVRAADNYQTDARGPSRVNGEGAAGSAKCVNTDATPAQYNFTATDVGSDCANDIYSCNRCGLVVGASF